MITTEEERSFLQQRFLSSLFCALLWGLVLLVPGAVNRQHWADLFSTGSHLTLLGVTWLIASRFRLSARLLSLVDVLPMLAVSLSLGVIAVVRDRLKAWLTHESWTEAGAANWWREWRREHAAGARSFEAAAMRLTVGLEARPSGYDGTRRGHDAA